MDHLWSHTARELRALWDNPMPLEPHEISNTLSVDLGAGDQVRALENLQRTLSRFLVDKKMGALAAALGMHPYVTMGNVTQRLSDYGQLLEPAKDERTVRRYAEAGAEALARQVTSLAGYVFYKRPSITVEVTDENDGLRIAVGMKRENIEGSMSLVVELADREPTVALNTFDDDFDSLELTGLTFPDNDPLTLRLYWVGTVTPVLVVNVVPALSSSMFAVSSRATLELRRDLS